MLYRFTRGVCGLAIATTVAATSVPAFATNFTSIPNECSRMPIHGKSCADGSSTVKKCSKSHIHYAVYRQPPGDEWRCFVIARSAH